MDGMSTFLFTVNWNYYEDKNNSRWTGICDEIPMLVRAESLDEVLKEAEGMSEFATAYIGKFYGIDQATKYFLDRGISFEVKSDPAPLATTRDGHRQSMRLTCGNR